MAAALYTDSYDVDQLYEITKIDRWFLYKIRNIVNIALQLEACRDKVTVAVHAHMRACTHTHAHTNLITQHDTIDCVWMCICMKLCLVVSECMN